MTIESLTFLDMKRCCHEHWNIVPADMVGKALTALQAEVVSLNTTIALWRPQGVTETIVPSADSLWITDLRSSAGCMFFFAHLEMEQMGGKQIRIFIATSLPEHTYTSRGQQAGDSGPFHWKSNVPHAVFCEAPVSCLTF